MEGLAVKSMAPKTVTRRVQHRLRPHHLTYPVLVLVVDPLEPPEPERPQDLLRFPDRGDDVGVFGG